MENPAAASAGLEATSRKLVVPSSVSLQPLLCQVAETVESKDLLVQLKA
jgi:hypothetical protein